MAYRTGYGMDSKQGRTKPRNNLALGQELGDERRAVESLHGSGCNRGLLYSIVGQLLFKGISALTF